MQELDAAGTPNGKPWSSSPTTANLSLSELVNVPLKVVTAVVNASASESEPEAPASIVIANKPEPESPPQSVVAIETQEAAGILPVAITKESSFTDCIFENNFILMAHP